MCFKAVLLGAGASLVAQESPPAVQRQGFDSRVGEGNGNPLQYTGKSQGQRTLVGYSSWGCKRVRHDLVLNKQTRKMQIFKHKIT